LSIYGRKLSQKSGGGLMANAERRLITAVWGGAGSPLRGPGAKPLVRGQGRSPLKRKAFCLSEVQMRRKFVHFCYPISCSHILFKRILLHFCLKPFYWSLHRGKKWGGGKLEPIAAFNRSLRLCPLQRLRPKPWPTLPTSVGFWRRNIRIRRAWKKDIERQS